MGIIRSRNYLFHLCMTWEWRYDVIRGTHWRSCIIRYIYTEQRERNSHNISSNHVWFSIEASNSQRHFVLDAEMKFNLSMLGLCVMFFLLSLVVGRSAGGVANPCKNGKFFDRLKQEYLPCHECKSETQECLTCCQLELEAQGKMFSIKRYVLFAVMVYFCRFVGLGLILFH